MKLRSIIIDIIVATAFIVLCFAIAYLATHRQKEIVTQVNEVTKTIEVPKETIVYKTVEKYVPVADQKQVKELLAQNTQLNLTVKQLKLDLIEAKSKGEGPVKVVEVQVDREVVKQTTFDDKRLSFVSDGVIGEYTLNQKFLIASTIAYDRHNTPSNITSVEEVLPDGKKIPVKVTESKTIATTYPKSHWFATPAIQAGVDTTQAVVIATPWLRKGSIESAEHSRYAALTPAATVKNSEVTVGVLPVSVNLGNVLRVPVKDVWASPFVGINTKTQAKRVAVTFTATF